MRYNKLVRDRIPEIIKRQGRTPKIHIADQTEYWEKLKEKLQEEVREFLEEENAEELADILEVLLAIRDFQKIGANRFQVLRKKKARERGVFRKRIILEEV